MSGGALLLLKLLGALTLVGVCSSEGPGRVGWDSAAGGRALEGEGGEARADDEGCCAL